MGDDPWELCERIGRALSDIEIVRLGYVFGSRARGRARADSDIDVAVLLDADAARRDRGAIIRRIAGRLGREVASTLLDIVILNDAPPLLRHRVLRDGRIVVQRSNEDRVRFALSTIREYQDGSIQRQRFADARVRRLKTGAVHGGSRHLLEKARSAARLLAEAARLS